MTVSFSGDYNLHAEHILYGNFQGIVTTPD